MKYQEFNGTRYCRDEKTGYYLCSTNRKRMHVAVWEAHNGVVPDGHDIHHANLDKADNRIENLRCMQRSEHQRLHWALGGEAKKLAARKNMAKASQAAKVWHSSDAGREWHRKHALSVAAIVRVPRIVECASCLKAFEAVDRKRKFCTNACKSAYRRKMGFDVVERQCAMCGDMFSINRFKEAKTCGRKCGYRLRIQNQRGMI